MNILSPLEQFEITSIISLDFWIIDLTFSNSALYILIGLSLLVFFGSTIYSIGSIIPHTYQNIFEDLYLFILGIITDNLGPRGSAYFPLAFFIFMFLFLVNLIGMVPYSFTITSHVVLTLAFSLLIFISVTLLSFKNHGIKFFQTFFPEGSPLAMAPLLVGIELISYLSRAFSLGIRLFANMMSGHILLKILVGFSWTMLISMSVMSILSLFPIGLLVALTGLECAIAGLQAYVFTVLTVLYINDAINLH